METRLNLWDRLLIVRPTLRKQWMNYESTIKTCIPAAICGCSCRFVKRLRRIVEKTEAPKLSVLSVKPIGLNLKSQVFRFNLNAFNPNSFKLPLQKIDFVARFSGIDVGEGSTTDGVTLSPNGDTAFSMDVATDLSKLVTNFGIYLKPRD